NLPEHYRLVMFVALYRIMHLTNAQKGYNLIKNYSPYGVVIAHDLAVLTAADQDTLGRLCKKLGRGGES
ncbi:MAG: hypothetical protein PVJ82_04290, partial [Desulfobacteraceae bacterium]